MYRTTSIAEFFSSGISGIEYDVTIPMRIGLTTLVTAALVAYFFWLILRVAEKKNKRVPTIMHLVIMTIGLLLTGFAT